MEERTNIITFPVRPKTETDKYRGYHILLVFDPVRKVWRASFSARRGVYAVPFDAKASTKATVLRKCRRLIDKLEDGE